MEETRLSAGEFCWVDVAVPDPTATHTFFSELFGWGRRVRPTEEADAYSIMTLNGRHVTGICEVEESETSRWMSYLLVEDLSKAADRAKSLGGEILKAGLEIPTFGLMTVVMDPTGAIFSLWESLRGEKAASGEPGTVCWVELVTNDVKKASKFYTELCGWECRETRFGDLDYYLFTRDGKDVAGMMALDDAANDKSISNWVVYYSVADCSAAAQRCVAAGGQIVRGPFPVEGLGDCAILSDPSGGVFGILQRH